MIYFFYLSPEKVSIKIPEIMFPKSTYIKVKYIMSAENRISSKSSIESFMLPEV